MYQMYHMFNKNVTISINVHHRSGSSEISGASKLVTPPPDPNLDSSRVNDPKIFNVYKLFLDRSALGLRRSTSASDVHIGAQVALS